MSWSILGGLCFIPFKRNGLEIIGLLGNPCCPKFFFMLSGVDVSGKQFFGFVAPFSGFLE